jgi:hypothetical protein
MFLLKRTNNICQALQKCVLTVERNYRAMIEKRYAQQPVDKKEM